MSGRNRIGGKLAWASGVNGSGGLGKMAGTALVKEPIQPRHCPRPEHPPQ